jgi:hypothetical protein
LLTARDVIGHCDPEGNVRGQYTLDQILVNGCRQIPCWSFGAWELDAAGWMLEEEDRLHPPAGEVRHIQQRIQYFTTLDHCFNCRLA